jgi:hypothetical protein
MPRNNVFFQLYNTVSTNNMNNDTGNSFIHLRFGETDSVLSGLRTGGASDCGTPIRHGLGVGGGMDRTGSFEEL